MTMKQNLQFSKLYDCQIMTGFGMELTVMDATAEMVLTKKHAPILWLDPAGTTKTVLLPAEADMKNKFMSIKNNADADGENIILEEDSSTTQIAVINRGETLDLFCDGTTWRVYSRNPGVLGARRTVRVPLTAVTGTTAGGILAWANPEGASIIVDRFMIDITTGSTGAATGDFGVAANGTTSNDTLLDGVNMQTTGIQDNIENQGTNGVAAKKMTSSQYITGTASATLAGMVGNAYISYFLA